MIMGFISFAILLATETDSFSSSEWYESFHFAHVVILFIGITFLVQSGALVALIHFRKRTLLSHDNCTSEQLLVEYIDMHEDGGWRQWLFMNGPMSIPVPELRERIEFKILQEFFIRSYNLPYEFKFATYMCRVLKDYVIALVEVRPISWMSLAALIGINYMRIKLIDPIFEADVCNKFPADIDHDSGSSSSHRFLTSVFMLGTSTNGTSTSDYGHRVCNEYTLRYTFFCEWLIFFYLLSVLIASEIYLSRLIGKVLDREEMIEWIEEEEEVAQEEARKRSNTLIPIEKNSTQDDPDDAPQPSTSSRPFQTMGLVHQNSNGLESSIPISDTLVQHLSPSERIATFRKEAVKRRSNSYDTGTGIFEEGVTIDRTTSMRRSNSYDGVGNDAIGNKSSNDVEMVKSLNPASLFHGPFRRENSAISDSVAGGHTGSLGENSHDAGHQGRGQINTQDGRRQLYFRCLERIMRVEMDFHQQEASDIRRGSITGPEESKVKHATVFTNDANTHVKPNGSTRNRSATLSGPSSVVNTPRSGHIADFVSSTGNGDRSSVNMMSNLNHLQMKNLQDAIRQNKHHLHPEIGEDHLHDKHSPPGDTNGSSILSSFYHAIPTTPNTHNDHHRKHSTIKEDFSMVNPTSRLFNNHDTHHTTRRTSHPANKLPIIDPQPEDSIKISAPPRIAETRQRGYSVHFFSTDEEEESKFARESEAEHHSPPSMGRQSSVVSAILEEKVDYCKVLLTKVMSVSKVVGHHLFDSIMGHHGSHHDHGLKPTEDIKELQKDFASIFVFHSAELYYYFVEMALLIQCLYIALWSTNLIVIAMDSYYPILWEVALVVPLPLNFFILKSIIFTSCTLRSIVTLDQRIASQICEKAEDERNVNMRLRRILRTALRKLNISRHDWDKLLKEKYDLCSSPYDGLMNQQQFKMFLHSLQIFLTDESLKNLFTVLDSDYDGKLMWEGLFPIIFPELQKYTIQIKKKRSRSNDGKGDRRDGSGTRSKSNNEDINLGNTDESALDGGRKYGSGDDKGKVGMDDGAITFEYSLTGNVSRPPKKRQSVLHAIRNSIVGVSLKSLVSTSGRIDHDFLSKDDPSIESSDKLDQEDVVSHPHINIDTESPATLDNHEEALTGTDQKQRPSLVGKLFPLITANEIQLDDSARSDSNQSQKIRFAENIYQEEATNANPSDNDNDDANNDDADDYDSQESNYSDRDILDNDPEESDDEDQESDLELVTHANDPSTMTSMEPRISNRDSDNTVIQASRQISYFSSNAKNFVDV